MYDAGVLYANAKALHELLQESRAENDKLRELVKYTLLCCERGWPCEECPLCGERGTSIDVDGREVTYTICKASDMAQGLGIEVDGCGLASSLAPKST